MGPIPTSPPKGPVSRFVPQVVGMVPGATELRKRVLRPEDIYRP